VIPKVERLEEIEMIVKVERYECGYVQLDRRILEDDRLSWKAKGLLAYLLSRPNDWSVQLRDLTKRSTDKEYAVRSALKELSELGYAEMAERRRKRDGTFEPVEYIVRELPLSGFRQVVPEDQTRPLRGYPLVDNRAVTNKESTNKEKEGGEAAILEEFSDILDPAERAPRTPSEADRILAEIKATMTTEQWKLAVATGLVASVHQEHEGGSWTVPTVAGGPDTMGYQLWATFRDQIGLGEVPEKRIKAQAKILRQLATSYRNMTTERAVEALEVCFMDSWLKERTKDPWFGTFQSHFNYCLSRAAAGTLDEYRREASARSSGVRSETGGADPGGGTSEDERSRREARERISRRRRESTEQSLPALSGTDDPQAGLSDVQDPEMAHSASP
jgi:hypothetical protein